MIDFLKLPSPCYVLDEELLDRNLAIIDRVRRESGAEIIVALKACAMWSIFPELARHSDGATASSAAEARLVFEEFGRPAHTYAPVYTDRNIEEILRCSDHITFNSVAQFERFGPMAPAARHFVRTADQSPVFARRDRPLQPPACSGFASGRYGRRTEGAAGGNRRSAFPRALRVASAPPAAGARSRRKNTSANTSTGSNGSIWAAAT